MSAITLLLLAAGSSSRMRGRDKLLEPVAGQPVLKVLALRGLRAGLPVIVTLPAEHDHARAVLLTETPVARIFVPDAATGMSASIRAGVRALTAQTEGVMILPADMPEISSDDIAALAASWRPGEILRATSQDGRAGHPVIFPRDLFDDLAHLTGDDGAKPVIVRHRARLRLHPLPGERALVDLDSPEDWDRWRSDTAP